MSAFHDQANGLIDRIVEASLALQDYERELARKIDLKLERLRLDVDRAQNDLDRLMLAEQRRRFEGRTP